MIFVIVGTHEQPFDRLVGYMDWWAGLHDEEVIIQTGYTRMKPDHCTWRDFFPYDVMIDHIYKARIVITHGGPSSIMSSLKIGKIPVVVPRQHRFDEHVNDHQLIFCREYLKREKNIILVTDIQRLEEAIESYDKRAARLKSQKDLVFESHNEEFCRAFKTMVEELCD